MTVDKRLTELETLIAFQDDTIKQLNDVIAAQQRQIDALSQEMKTLKQQFKEMTPSPVVSASDETPPHY